MSIDSVFQYPPELMSLLIDTIPLLMRGKKDVFLFFQGAGVPSKLMEESYKRWQQDKDSITKFEIVRSVLTNLNAQDDVYLRERREVLKRVVEFDSFSSCWETDRLKAKGLVGEVREIINVKDSFTRMSMEREAERKEKLENRRANAARVQKHREEVEDIKKSLFALFSEPDPWKRGKDLEGVLNRLFKAYGILVRNAFTLQGKKSEGIVEQVDGVIEFDNHLYFVEMKWCDKAIGKGEVAEHLVRVYGRAETRAIIISASGFAKPAITVAETALRQKIVVLCTLQEIVALLEGNRDLVDFLRRKVHGAMIDNCPFIEVLK